MRMAQRANLQEMPKIQDRITFIYLERCYISRENTAIKAEDKEGYVLIPSHSCMVLLLGPGVRISHRAMELICDSGVTIIWTGEYATKYYCAGRALNSNTQLLQQQAKLVSNPRLHLKVVRKMYAMRFPDEDISSMTLQQLRGKEGSRVRALYKKCAKDWGIEWSGRKYDSENFENSDDVNKALSTANVCLYGLTRTVISALGLSCGLGFIHVGHEQSFVYDVADLYKAQYTIPLAFELASLHLKDIASETRKRMRFIFYESHLVEQMIKDLKYLLEAEENEEDRVLCIWDGKRGNVEAGIQHYEHKDKDRKW